MMDMDKKYKKNRGTEVIDPKTLFFKPDYQSGGDDNNDLNVDDVFKLTDLYFKRKYILYSHHQNSFDKFIEDNIRSYLLEGENKFFEKIDRNNIYRHKFVYSDIKIKPPTIETTDEIMFPQDARVRNLTYSSKIIATVRQIQEIEDINTNKITVRPIGNPYYNYNIATIPIMVRSKYCSLNIKKGRDKRECPYDPGGYFIINGQEKVVMSLEGMIHNKPIVLTKKESNVIIHKVMIKSKFLDKPTKITQTITIILKKNNRMNILVPILHEISVFILIKALGVETDKDIINMIVYNENDYDMINLVRKSLDKSTIENSDIKIINKEQAINYLITKIKVLKRYSATDEKIKNTQKRIHLDLLLREKFMPHMDKSTRHKAYYLGYMINRLLNCVLKRIKVDRRDDYINKRIDTPGKLLFELYMQFHRKMINNCRKFFGRRNNDDRMPHNVINQIKPNIIEQGLKNALLTGVWGNNKRKGVAQMLQRYSYVQTMASLRRVNSPTVDASTNKLTAPRHADGNQAGFLSFAETPEGVNVGLVKHLALTATITVMLSSQISIIKNFLNDKLIDTLDVKYGKINKYFKVFLNGEWMGLAKNHDKLFKMLKEMKFSGTIDKYTSITYVIRPEMDLNEIRINCDGGRLIRPVLRVENNTVMLNKDHINAISLDRPGGVAMVNSWDELITKYPRCIEYIDSDESYSAHIATYPYKVREMKNKMIKSIKLASKLNIKDNYSVINRYDDKMYVKYTHSEIHPSLILGIVTANIPYLNSNQGPRNMFQFSQARQAQGLYISNYRHRLDISYMLFRPEKPLVTTRAMKYIHTDILTAIQNVIVAVMCYTGYNQEDSVIFNQSAIDRGLFRSVTYKKVISSIKKNQSTSDDDIFMKPDRSKVIGMGSGSYDKLNEKGYVPEETVVVKGDILIGLVSPIQPIENTNKSLKDNSSVYKAGVPGTVDKVWTGIYNQDGYEMRKMRIRSERKPMIGDKFCCYSPSHDVLTEKGWKNITKITKEDRVASLVNGNTLKYVNPLEIQKYDYKGKMYVVKSKQVSLKVTPNHRMYVSTRTGKYKIELAEKIYGKRRKYLKNVENVIIDTENIPRELKINEEGQVEKFIIFNKNDKIVHEFDIDSWLMLFGIWIAEGGLGERSVVIAAHKDRVKEALKKCCKNMKLKISKSKDHKEAPTNNIYSIHNTNIAKCLKPMKGSLNKYLPDWVWCLSMEQCKILLNGLMLGDGHVMKGTVTMRYDTSSIKLRNDVQKLALHCGYSANWYLKYPAGRKTVVKTRYGKKLKKWETIISTADAYRLTIVSKQNKPLVNKNIKLNGDNRLDKWVDYDGQVYCCTVPGDGIIYIRRNGLSVWCGQSRHGQKGTIGLILPEVDMPFTKDGMRPDMIMNPNAFPSRMTFAQFIECIGGKVAAMLGIEVDGTPFNNVDVRSLQDTLEELGFNGDGTEEMYNGMTGKKIKSKIFIGPLSYQRLKHQVADKLHSRSRGPRQLLTRQAPEGRARDGGLRFGEMERDCIISHGMSRFLKERLLETADLYTTYICGICGLIAQRLLKKDNKPYPTSKDIWFCPKCKNYTNIHKVRIPYAFKLFVQEMMSMEIAPRMRVKESKYD
uniref:DNA-directed RNA polymerase n=1 Tax=Mimivirus LCMiAC02 TaxID=2506609 RepID=A0A481Z1S9_9VIRU|nr:MAG: DNA-directed RNA polymerase subunit beta [Mimivirus LCMiAC02]